LFCAPGVLQTFVMSWDIRPYRESDIEAVSNIYRSSISQSGVQHYTREQIDAWASFPDDAEAFNAWIGSSKTFVATDNEGIAVGFGGIEESGRIASLFVAPASMRQGIGTSLVSRLLSEARRSGIRVFSTAASEYSRAVFARFGFEVTEIEHTEINGVAFTRYAMHLHT
jgi:putative acetyltransferase